MSWHRLFALACLPALSLQAAGPGENSTLSESVQAGDRAAVEKLIQKGANVNAADPDGMTPLAWAARGGDVKLTAVLLQAGASAKLLPATASRRCGWP